MRVLALMALTAGICGAIPSAVPAQTPDTADNASPTKSAELKAVVELFTSQGCSSCPRADAVLTELAKRNDVVALSLPVDYWDYLGWRDTLANPRFSARQRAYALARGDGAIYTPQAVVNGVAHVNGGDEAAIGRYIEKTGKAVSASYVPVRLSEDKDSLVVEVGTPRQGGSIGKDATLWLAVFAREVTVAIARGENQGKTVTYSNVVRELMPIGTWSGKPMTVQLARHSFMREGADGCAAFLQQGKGGPIVGAALLQQC